MEGDRSKKKRPLGQKLGKPFNTQLFEIFLKPGKQPFCVFKVGGNLHQQMAGVLVPLDELGAVFGDGDIPPHIADLRNQPGAVEATSLTASKLGIWNPTILTPVLG